MQIPIPAPLSVPVMFINLAIGMAVSLVLSWCYVRLGQSYSNRTRFAPMLPMLTLITVLVISVVKSSLALSLGLVGALSIVRFRTAIKDPEELMFLFLAIAVGLGLGADQRVPTVVAVAVIIAYLLLRSLYLQRRFVRDSLYLNIEVESERGDSSLFSQINQLLLRSVSEVDLRRMDSSKGILQITYYLAIPDQETLVAVMDSLKEMLPNSSISLVQQNNLLGGGG